MVRGSSSSAPAAAGRVILRVLAIVIGGYAASASLVAVATATLSSAGVSHSDAYTFCAMLGFLVYLVLALWAATERRLALVVVALVGLTAGSVALSILLAFAREA